MMPATYNLEYYRGDTLTFKINVKDASGAPLDVSAGSLAFTVATGRGSAPPDPGDGFPATVVCSATAIGSQITCTISPANGSSMKAGVPYVYDVQWTNAGEVHTYLTGNINVTEGVS